MPVGPDTTRHGEARANRFFAAGTEGQLTMEEYNAIQPGSAKWHRGQTALNIEQQPSFAQPDAKPSVLPSHMMRPAHGGRARGGPGRLTAPNN